MNNYQKEAVKNHCPYADGFPDVEIIGASSDMLILDLGENKNGLKAGDSLKFTMNYMAVLRAMNSDYVDKKISNKIPASELKILEFKN